VQYGARIEAFVVYLLHAQLLPEKRVAALIADLFGVALTTATIATISRNCAERLRPFAETVRDHVAQAPVKHRDETGFRIAGKTQWLHVASTLLMTFYICCSGCETAGRTFRGSSTIRPLPSPTIWRSRMAG
jgi:transposase